MSIRVAKTWNLRQMKFVTGVMQLMVFLVKTPAARHGTSARMPPKSKVLSFIPMFLPNQEKPGTTRIFASAMQTPLKR